MARRAGRRDNGGHGAPPRGTPGPSPADAAPPLGGHAAGHGRRAPSLPEAPPFRPPAPRRPIPPGSGRRPVRARGARTPCCAPAPPRRGHGARLA